MVTRATARPTIATDFAAPADRIGGLSAVALAVTGFVYSLSFIIRKNDALTAAMLTASDLIALLPYSALSKRLRAAAARQYSNYLIAEHCSRRLHTERPPGSPH